MQTLTLDLGTRSYPIFISASLLKSEEFWDSLRAQLNVPEQLLLVSDEHVAPLYAQAVQDGLAPAQTQLLVLPAGESSKNTTTLNRILDTLVEGSYQRDAAVVALGGGVVGDMAGFAAACYMRGIAFIQIPTTLLAQVDSSVGGKTGINHALGKNLIGAFHQPRAVIIDTTTLATLDPRELRAGLAEVIKYGCMYDADFFAWLETNITALLALDAEALSYAIKRSCEIKADVVARDEREKGERALLNFGHSFGHAIEQYTQYKIWLHGEAVAVGMLMAAHLSVHMGLLDEPGLQRIHRLIEAADLPVNAGSCDVDALLVAMKKDKKNTASEQRLIVLNAIGTSEVRNDCPADLVKASLHHYCQPHHD